MRRIGWRGGWLVTWWLCCLVCCGMVRAAPLGEPVVLKDTATEYLHGAQVQVQVLEDVGGSLTLAQAQAATAWQALKGGQPSFGYTGSAFWLRVVLRNAHPTQEAWQFGVRYPLLDEVDLHVLDAAGQVRQHHATGDRRAFGQRPVAHPDFYVNVPLR